MFQPKPEGIAFPSIIDNTMRTSFISCPQKMLRSHLLHYSKSGRKVHLDFGGAFAEGLDVFRKSHWEEGKSLLDSYFAGLSALTHKYGMSEEELEDPEKNFVGKKTYSDLVAAYDSYWKEYNPVTHPVKPVILPSGKLASEINFLLELPQKHPVTGDPLLYSGRLDHISLFSGAHWGMDEKTASALGPSWAAEWSLRSQFIGYSVGGDTYDLNLAGTIVRGVGILKGKITHQQVVVRTTKQLRNLWWEQLRRDVDRMLAAWREGWFDYNLSDTCNDYGGCDFRDFCGMPNEKAFLENTFNRSVWKPELGQRIPLAEAYPNWKEEIDYDLSQRLSR